MRGVLDVGHGSRQSPTKHPLETIAEMLRAALFEASPDMVIATAYLGFGERDIANGLSALAAQGAREIAVVPCFLFDGVHLSVNIPKEVELYRLAHPEMTIEIAGPLGTDERLAAILMDRVHECFDSQSTWKLTKAEREK